jgi:hydrogenase nickel incorporation protein HypA/HybF
MHELSVAESLVELVAEQVRDDPSARVAAVRLRLGPLSGVVAQALAFAYDDAAAGTVLEGSVLEIEEVTAAVYCPRCRAEKDLPDVRRLRCPECGAAAPDHVRGRELEVSSVTLLCAPTTPP